MKHFIFGYGSLICPQSRAITAPTLQSIAEPVMIRHIERTWSARVSRPDRPCNDEKEQEEPQYSKNTPPHIEGWTPMGIRQRRGAKCNGVLIHVDEEELARFDVREAGYERHLIDVADIYYHDHDQHNEGQAGQNEHDLQSKQAERADHSDLAKEGISSTAFMYDYLGDVQCEKCRVVFEKGYEKRCRKKESNRDENEKYHERDDEECRVWVYIQSLDQPPNRSYPIPQSYVDIIMRGCLSISNDFARRFLETTQGWWHDGQLDAIDTSCNGSNDIAVKEMKEYNLEKILSSVDGSHHTWVNDRHSPMYVRADRQYSFEKGEEIDQLIKECHPHALMRRVVSM